LETLNFLSWTVAWFIVVLGLMIFIHELGHYLMAKFLGIRVEVFSLGFGPRLVGFKKGDTDYRVSLLPLGGYVRMTGEHFDDELTGSEEEFLSRPKSHRFAVAVAGPVMNILLAVLLLAGNFMAGIQVPAFLSQPPVIGYIAESSPAAETDLRTGDRIISLGGTRTPTWEDVQLVVATSPGQEMEMMIERDGRQVQRIVRVLEDPNSGIGFLGVYPAIVNLISTVQDGPAKGAGLQAGDIVLAASSGEKSYTRLADILNLISSNEGKPIHFTIKRGQDVFTREITPKFDGEKARIGIAIGETPPPETRLERYGPLEAIGRSIERNLQLTGLTFRIVGKLITGQTSIRMMSGPIEIAKYSGQAASQGTLALVGFMALISLQLGIFNLFPIPILDGGVIALLVIEGILRRDLSLKVKERIFQVGFIFLILLMGIVLLNDISKNI